MDRIEKLRGVRVLVVGDVMLDLWEVGEDEQGDRVADARPGGAGNVAANVEALGGKAIVVGVVGDDANAHGLDQALVRCGVAPNSLVMDGGRVTTTKLYKANGKRKSRETLKACEQAIADKVFTVSMQAVVHVDAVILSDYGKGVLCSGMAGSLIRLARSHRKPVVVDPWGLWPWKYAGATLIKPNAMELRRLAGKPDVIGSPDSFYPECVESLWKDFKADYLTTLGAGGILYSDAKSGVHTFRDAHAVEVANECGAGDSAAAVCGMALGAGLKLPDVAELANLAGAAAVSLPMTATPVAAHLREIARSPVRR